MTRMVVYCLNTPKVIQETFEDEVVVIHFDHGHYFSIRAIGADIWRMLIAGNRIADIDVAISARFADAEPEVAAHFLHTLLTHNLVRVSDQTAAAVVDSGLFVSTLYATPVLEEYSDMSELLLLDPIHEVDPQGWPKTAAKS